MAINKLTPPIKKELLTNIQQNRSLKKENLGEDEDGFPAHSYPQKYNQTSGQVNRTKLFFYYYFSNPADPESKAKIAKKCFFNAIPRKCPCNSLSIAIPDL